MHNEADSHNENGENGGLDAAGTRICHTFTWTFIFIARFTKFFIETISFAEPQHENKEKKNDIDKIDEQETGEEQANPHHNELEEPPEPEDIDLSNINLDNNEDNNEKEDRNEENPFDIDTMKDNMKTNENESGEENENENGKQDDEAQKGDEGIGLEDVWIAIQ